MQNCGSVMFVYSDGAVFSLFENAACELIARPSSKKNHLNLIDGELIQISNNMLVNLKSDKVAELYRYVDKKLTLVGLESMKLASVA